jgi:K+-transporting ATPase KdpF subunit
VQVAYDRYCLSSYCFSPFPCLLGAAGFVPAPYGGMMNLLYLIAGLIAVALLVYLVLALLKPEWFG